MKKLFLLILMGCGYAPIPFNHPVVISKIESLNIDNECMYYTIFTESCRYTISCKGRFIDKCGKYTVGDTVNTYKGYNNFKK